MRTIDAFRDDEQHWYNQLSEGLLYAHARAVVTLFDDLLQREFDDRLANYLPLRVLPISAEPPKDIQLLIDDEYQRIAELLRPGKRQRAEAKARIRSLLAMEAHVAEGVLVSRKDVSRVERAILQKKDRHHVFPRLSNLGTEIAGDGLQVTVRFSKNKGAPVRLVGADDDVEAAAIREVDLQRKYHFSPAELAKHLHLSPPRTVALRRFLGIDEDPACRHDFIFGSQTHRGYSDNAVVKMTVALTEVDMDEVWRTHGPRRRAAGDLSETA